METPVIGGVYNPPAPEQSAGLQGEFTPGDFASLEKTSPQTYYKLDFAADDSDLANYTSKVATGIRHDNDGSLATNWYVGGERTTAGQLILGLTYQSLKKLDNRIVSTLNTMSGNSLLAKRAGELSDKISTTAGTTKTAILELITSNNLTAGTGLTAEEMLTAMIPNCPTTILAADVATTLRAPLEKYAQAKLTDNQVMQQKLSVDTATRDTMITAMTNIMKGWADLLKSLGRI